MNIRYKAQKLKGGDVYISSRALTEVKFKPHLQQQKQGTWAGERALFTV